MALNELVFGCGMRLAKAFDMSQTRARRAGSIEGAGQRRRGALDERGLSELFRRLLLVVSVAPLAACGGIVTGDRRGDSAPENPDAQDDGATSPDSVGPICDTTGKPKPGDPIPSCGYSLPFVGDKEACAGFDATGYGSPALCARLCGHPTACSYYDPGAGHGTPVVHCGGPCEGRRPEAFTPFVDAQRGAVVGRYFARAAHLEAVSIDAFRILRAELRAHRAPKRLLRAASRAARDEIRHARTARALARSYGVRAERPVVARSAVRSLAAIALENAVEGCVRETFGALVASAQACDAIDPQVRAAMVTIARDETRHAALGWELARWLRPRLDAETRARVDAAMREAITELRAECATSPTAELRALAGLPDATRALALVDGLAAEVWARVG